MIRFMSLRKSVDNKYGIYVDCDVDGNATALKVVCFSDGRYCTINHGAHNVLERIVQIMNSELLYWKMLAEYLDNILEGYFKDEKGGRLWKTLNLISFRKMQRVRFALWLAGSHSWEG